MKRYWGYQWTAMYILLFNFQIENISKLRGEGRVPGIAGVFFHMGKNSWLGIFHTHFGQTIDYDFIHIFAIMIVLLDSDIILFSQRIIDIFAIVSVSRNSRTDMEKATFVYPNSRNLTANEKWIMQNGI